MADLDYDPFGPSPFQFDPFAPGGTPLEPGESYAITVTGDQRPLVEPVIDRDPQPTVTVSFQLPESEATRFELRYSPAEMPTPTPAPTPAPRPKAETVPQLTRPYVDEGWFSSPELRKLNAFHLRDSDPPSLKNEFSYGPYDASKAVKSVPRTRLSRSVVRSVSSQEYPPCPRCGEMLGLGYHCEQCGVEYCSACMGVKSDGCCTNRACPAYAEPCQRCGNPIPSTNLGDLDPALCCQRCGRNVCGLCSSSAPAPGNSPYDYLCLDCIAQCEEELRQNQQQESQET